MTTQTTTLRGILISSTEPLQSVDVTTVETWKAIQTTIDARNFDVIGGRDGIDLYVDDEGLINGAAFNLPLTIVAHTLGAPVALFGTGLALSVDDDGETQGLTDEQAQTVTSAIESTPSPEVVDAVVETLSVHPAFLPYIVLLRAM